MITVNTGILDQGLVIYSGLHINSTKMNIESTAAIQFHHIKINTAMFN